MTARPEERYRVDFTVFISWLDRQGGQQRTTARCVDLSASGAQVETKDALEARGMVVLSSECFGRMGNAVVRYCRRQGMRYQVGLQFSMAFTLSDPGRRKILAKLLPGEPRLDSARG